MLKANLQDSYTGLEQRGNLKSFRWHLLSVASLLLISDLKLESPWSELQRKGWEARVERYSATNLNLVPETSQISLKLDIF